ncbi:hypothetical protein PLEOSDRAFT_1109637 [Pleurotus ostreatus PC15]|uniref:DNA 3'-5' helicase n=1 Tax=Pleurotus ostreatus (strain PC15) TaxID=1137138 RepID=A0A067NEI3_PLEO1|nr:hypothetical protein PLEOSDRAFT_1109637 [Pleurotus ostreatus PC15]
MNQVEEICSEHVDQLDEDGRVLIYCSSYRECDDVFERTRYPIHRAKGSTGDDDEDDAKKRQAVAHDWRAGRPKVLIATTGFGNGIDYAHVRVVISVNARNGSDAVQQTGRAGRDGKQAYAYILGSLPLLASAVPDPDFAGVAIMNMLYAKRDCIRICMGEFDTESYSCVSHGSSRAVLCTRCKSSEFTKSMSLIPTQPGPRNYRVRSTNTPVVSSQITRPSPHINTSLVPPDSKRRYIPGSVDRPPQPTANLIHTIDDISDDMIAVHPFDTPASPDDRLLTHKAYPTPASPLHTVQRSRASKQSMSRPSAINSSELSLPTISAHRQKGKGRTNATHETSMPPPLLPQERGIARGQPSVTPDDDVFSSHYPNVHGNTGQPSGQSDRSTSRPSTTRYQLTLPSVPTYKGPTLPHIVDAASPPVDIGNTRPSDTLHTKKQAHRHNTVVSTFTTSAYASPRGLSEPAPANTIRSISDLRKEAVDERQELSDVRRGHFAIIDQFFSIRPATCVICCLLGNAHTGCQENLYMTCESGLFNPWRSSVNLSGTVTAASEFNKFRTTLRFQEDQHVCYHCMRQTDIDAHPHVTTVKTCDEFADVIKNFAWAVYCLPAACSEGREEGRRWRKALLDTFDPPPPTTRPDFEQWLSTTPDPQGLNITNILMLCIHWTVMYKSHRWPPP